jgi:hypothetical protein
MHALLGRPTVQPITKTTFIQGHNLPHDLAGHYGH